MKSYPQNITFDLFIPLGEGTIYKFLYDNGLHTIKARVPVVSNISDSTYGVVYFADDKLVFCKHKAIEINKNEKLPRACTEIQKTFKIISREDFEKKFRQTHIAEITILEMIEEKNL